MTDVELFEAPRFYTFYQNNSGGDFVVDERSGIAHYVIIEARNAEDANRRAIMHGLYFDGTYGGPDCSCCGDRWSAKWQGDEGTAEPMVYDQTPDQAAAEEHWCQPGEVAVVIVRLTGQINLIRK